MVRIAKRVGIGLAGLIVLALAVVYGGSQWVLSRSHAAPLDTVAVPKDAASIAEGGRMARVMGCRDCHGASGEGLVLLDDPMLGRIAPPAFADIASRYSDAEIVRAVRQGVRRDGTTLWVMPSASHAYIADDDMGRIIAWIRSVKPGPKDETRNTSFGPVGRALVLTGMFKGSAHDLSAAPKQRPADMGQYVVQTSCLGCHAMDRERPSDDGKQIVPPLAAMAASYDTAAFRKLLHTGVGMTNRDLGMMRTAALGGYAVLTDPEIDAIHAYLKKQAEQQ
ncbi:c-type cytochrome [Sphingomonas sp. AOB5]|uniref:c-type cytochrome n=1 Tax=Sphingomonas sp. AOB5 TaxID=3034017 RepID=UPI0023F6C632|nr:c-type cytochrome [Sphingomonas sp. AOB5]MDF7775222.1 c-type cytochrome [Sphingomonas sp. AOB5]